MTLLVLCRQLHFNIEIYFINMFFLSKYLNYSYIKFASQQTLKQTFFKAYSIVRITIALSVDN